MGFTAAPFKPSYNSRSHQECGGSLGQAKAPLEIGNRVRVWANYGAGRLHRGSFLARALFRIELAGRKAHESTRGGDAVLLRLCGFLRLHLRCGAAQPKHREGGANRR
jgi:hypothetical protein